MAALPAGNEATKGDNGAICVRVLPATPSVWGKLQKNLDPANPELAADSPSLTALSETCLLYTVQTYKELAQENAVKWEDVERCSNSEVEISSLSKWHSVWLSLRMLLKQAQRQTSFCRREGCRFGALWRRPDPESFYLISGPIIKMKTYHFLSAIIHVTACMDGQAGGFVLSFILLSRDPPPPSPDRLERKGSHGMDHRMSSPPSITRRMRSCSWFFRVRGYRDPTSSLENLLAQQPACGVRHSPRCWDPGTCPSLWFPSRLEISVRDLGESLVLFGLTQTSLREIPDYRKRELIRGNVIVAVLVFQDPFVEVFVGRWTDKWGWMGTMFHGCVSRLFQSEVRSRSGFGVRETHLIQIEHQSTPARAMKLSSRTSSSHNSQHAPTKLVYRLKERRRSKTWGGKFRDTYYLVSKPFSPCDRQINQRRGRESQASLEKESYTAKRLSSLVES
ncbi:hypothetical protein RRG08_008475 [Elysia crispata]|uniref:Uncharacterized protein n=1 Tax=Elysia crispata TaxID=231223 RepID=A0AAE1DC75_9GAST|nr:hypothetical protein RRG08_008475 [Elysia crispata]